MNDMKPLFAVLIGLAAAAMLVAVLNATSPKAVPKLVYPVSSSQRLKPNEFATSIFAGSKEPAPPTEVGGFHLTRTQQLWNRYKGGANQADDGSLFAALTPVLRHPRCMNCHSTGDFPRQGDDGHPHTMNVRRGPGGMGVTAEKCTTCHQDHNLEGQHLPPGAPGWHLPPPAMPMIWQGHSDAEICKQITDPKQNGGRSIALIARHMTEDKLVLWGWNPGEGRNPVSMSHDEFSAKVKAWAAAGGPCPAK